MNPKERLSISTVEYTSPAGNSVECLSRDEIENACVAEGQRRFTQAQYTPFLQGSLVRRFGYNAAPEATMAVLEGSFEPEQDVSSLTRQFIHELKCQTQ